MQDSIKQLKNERRVVMLNTTNGEFVLRREGGNAFSDPALQRLEGKAVKFTGRVHEYTFIVSDWEVVKPKSTPRPAKANPRARK